MNLSELQITQLIDQARSFVREERYLHALQCYRRLLIDDPTCLSAYRELAALYGEMDLPDAAVSLLEGAERAMPGCPDVTFLLAMRHLESGAFDRAIERLRTLADRRLPQVHFQLGVAHFYQEDLATAEAEFRTALALDPHFPRINESIGELLLERGEVSEAIEFLRRGIDIDPYSAVSHSLLGNAFGELGRWTEAHDEFILALDMDPTEAQHWQAVGESMLHQRRSAEAEPYLRKARDLDPSSVDIMLALCKALLMKGDRVEARELRSLAFSLDPAHARAGEVRWRIRHAASHRSHGGRR